MKRKIAVITGILLAAIVVLAIGVPALAQTSSDSAPSVAVEQQIGHKRVLARLLLVQDEAKVNELIAKAKESGKITDEQATKLKGFWTEHHEQFTKKWVLTRIIWAKDGDKVQAFLDKAVAAGKIQQDGADKLMQLWEYLQ